MTAYQYAPEVAGIAADLIRDVEAHKPLDGVRIDYVWRDTAARSKGRVVLGKARRITGLNAYLIQADGDGGDLFVVEIAADTWRGLTDIGRRALVDHELCHLKVVEDDDGTPVLTLRGHDIEEFAAVVERHGLWASDVANFGTAVAEQLVLPIDEIAEFVDGLGDSDPDTDQTGGAV